MDWFSGLGECCYSRERDGGVPANAAYIRETSASSTSPSTFPDASRLITPMDLKEDADRSRETLRRHVEATIDDPSVLVYWIEDPRRDPRDDDFIVNGQDLVRKSVAGLIPPNSDGAVRVESTGFVGSTLWMQRLPSGQARYHSHFDRRRRNWELRVQGRFKFVPRGRIHCGIVLRDFNYNQAVARFSEWVKSAGCKLIPFDGAYVCWGDRCQASEKPDAELSHLVSDLAGWDQIIVTPGEEAPPDITGELSGQGLQRDQLGVSKYSAKVNEVVAEINTTNTYTFCFWGCSRYVDTLSWQFKIGFSYDMATFFQEWPLHAVMYELDPAKLSADDNRHLESRKNYILDFMFWNNGIQTHSSLPSRYNFKDLHLAKKDVKLAPLTSIASNGNIEQESTAGEASETPKARRSQRSHGNAAPGRFRALSELLSRAVCGRGSLSSRRLPRGDSSEHLSRTR